VLHDELGAGDFRLLSAMVCLGQNDA
jgi:hypothetical protein